MKISLNWIKDYVNLDGISVHDIWYRFTMSAAEVEEVTETGSDIKNVIVAKVLEAKPHPTSAKLKICLVDTGSGIVQSVCGAPNVREGLLVPFALPGGSIKRVGAVSETLVAGIESRGVICSAAELGISDSHEGVCILEGDFELGTDIKSIIGIDDIILEIDNKSLTNRPDLWGHYGIAREMAAIFRRPLKPLEVEEGLENSGLPDISIKILDAEKCFRFSGLRIDAIKAKTATLNMQTRLYYCGMRSISLLVDLTNYLMMETGQPMHAYDKRQFQGIVVKSTEEPLKFTTLDSIERTIPADVLMICNNEKPVGIAGIMGGENSEIMADTEGILLESANFEGSSLRRNATRMGMRTEASSRFEKMLDPELTVLSIKRFVKLLKDVQKDVVIASNLTNIVAREYDKVSLTVTRPFIDKYVGNSISDSQVVDILRSLEFEVEQQDDKFLIKVPSFRATKDITINADIIEEISRIYGYDNIVPETIEVPLKPLEYNEEKLFEHRVRECLAEKFALNEVNSYAWFNETANREMGIAPRGHVRLMNPHAKDMTTLRDSMVPTMLEFAGVNRKSFDEFAIFEIGSVFDAKDFTSPCNEHKSLCVLKASKTDSEDQLFYQLKGVADSLLKSVRNSKPVYTMVSGEEQLPWVHPVKSAVIACAGKVLGKVSAIHPQIRQNLDKKLNIAFLEIDISLAYKIEAVPVKFREPSRYPAVTLDFSFLVDVNVGFDTIWSHISEFKEQYFKGFEFVGIYTGKGLPENKKSMTFRFEIVAKDKTLSSEEINGFTDKLLVHMAGRNFILR